jgi:hypothetical protein
MRTVTRERRWRRRKNRVIRHLAWAVMDKKESRDIQRIMVSLFFFSAFCVLGGVVVGVYTTWYVGLVLVGLGGLPGVIGVTTWIHEDYKQQIGNQLAQLAYRPGAAMLVHRWWGVDETLIRLSQLGAGSSSKGLTTYFGPGGRDQIAFVPFLTAFWRTTALYCSEKNLEVIIYVLHDSYEAMGELVGSVWPLVTGSGVRDRDIHEIFFESARALRACAEESDRAMLLDMAAHIQCRGSAHEIMSEVKRCVVLVGQRE